MKKKIYNICGVALALVLVFSLFGAFVPVKQVEAQAYTPNQWNAMTLPAPGPPQKLLPGSAIPDFAVASDGNTIYALDAAAIATPILRSPNGGTIWSTVPTLATAVGYVGPPKLVAVAPDDPNVVAVVATGAAATDAVFYSTSGGATWSFMGLSPGGATEIITDIAVSPARIGPLLSRDIVVCTSNTATNTFGDVYIVPGAIWTPAATTAGLVQFDFTSLALSTNWAGDRVVIAVGSEDGSWAADANNPVATVAWPGDTYLCLINVAPIDLSPPGAPTLVAPSPVLIEAVGRDSPAEMDVAGVPNGILSSSVALPMDFDSTTVMGRRSFVGWTSGSPVSWADDAWRVDNASVRKLEIAAQVGIFTVSYSGTISAGTLFAGETAGTVAGAPAMVWYSADPQSAIPTWSYSFKPPTGALGVAAANVVVAVSPDFDSSGVAYAATIGADSAFSRSKNGGVSFNQIGLINEAPPTLQDVMMTPDSSEVFLASDDGAGNHSLWWSKAKPTGDSWERVRFKPTGTPNSFTTPLSIIRLSPEYDTDFTIYWCDAGAGSSGRIERSVDGSDVFATRTAPAAIADVTVESKDILYMGDAAANLVRKSINGGWFFELPIAAAVFNVNQMVMCPSYPEKPVPGNLLIGGIGGGVCLSLNAGASFIPLLAGVGGATFMQVLADVDYADNSTVYAGSFTAGQGIWRYEFGVSTAWEQILLPGALLSAFPAAATMTGLGMHCGTLYGSWTSAAVAALFADAFTVTGAAAARTGFITIASGQVTVATTGTATIAGMVPAATATITAGLGAVPWTLPLVTDTLVITATQALTTGNIVQTPAAPLVTITAVVDTDVDVLINGVTHVGALPIALTGGGGADTFSLPDAVVVVPGLVASAADRSLVPWIPVIANWTFESMDVGSALATFNVAPSALRVGGTADMVTLWAIDTMANALMAYDDTIAKATPVVTVPASVPFDAVSGRNAEFAVTWPQVSNATAYNVEFYTDSACTHRIDAISVGRLPGAGWIPASVLSPAYVVLANTLVAGTDYWVRIRVRDQIPTDSIMSNWSKVVKFSVAGGERVEVSYLGVQPLGPVPGATDVPLSPGFTWSPYAQSTKYEFQLATDALFTDILAEAKLASTGYKYDGKLSYATTYFWRARGIEPTVTSWSPVSSFTTEKKAVPPVVIEPTPIPPTPAPIVTPAIIWAIIAIGAILVIAVIVLILRTRRVA